eukprot:TRINITY_DN3013_c0_g1_i9.p1 TRINITY_DN3013_c0_g1~~TRINITY_DN3013_c0_g1_i9.p1  ORF type:complete len:147 (+),score=13.98 TRINITY_DN3013_c0_g1_i9:55-441(+)
MWCELFPHTKVFGLDLDPSNFESNRANLKAKGMNDENLKVLQMDQTLDNTEFLKRDVGGKFTFVIDDGCHTAQCARLTIKSFFPQLTEKFVYIIEDSGGSAILDEIRALDPKLKVEQRGQLTLVSRGL